MKHIAFLIPTIDRIGGAENQLVLLARGLADRGWRVTVIALSGSGANTAEELHGSGITFLSLRMRKGLADPRGWMRLNQWIRHHQPDVLHAHLPHAVLIARWSRLLAPSRILVETIHSPAVGGLLRRFAYRVTMQQPDAITAVSQACAEPWLIERMVDRTRLTVIRNGIELNHWRSNAEVRRTVRSRLHVRDEFLWLAVGRLEPVKDHAILLRAFARIPSCARLLIAGAGTREEELRQMASNLGVEDRVRFLGFQRDVRPWLQAADGFALTSRWEGLPLAFLEAAACELPVIYTDIPAMRAEVSDASCSAGVPVGDAHALAVAMSSMMQRNPQERAAIGSRLRRSVAERFSLASVLNQWEETYSSLLAVKPHPTRSGNTACSLLDNTFQLQ
jgi:glycosyltransferase involved in cell wall biosynthesis